MTNVLLNLQYVKDRIAAAAGRSDRTAEEVKLLLVTKTIESPIILEAIRAGQIHLGENKVQEGLRKSKELESEAVRWSMIGHLQSNKVKEVLSFASEVQSLDRLSLAAEMDKRLQAQGRSMDVLVQVNTSQESSKYGLHPDEVAQFLREVTVYQSLRIKGFMTLATFTHDEKEVRRCFRLLRELRDRARNDAPQGGALQELSMGMSGDFEWAIEEGATVVRVGQAVFGARAYPASYYWPGIEEAT